MIDRDDTLPVTSQCELLEVARSTVYYQPKPTPAGDIDLMGRIDHIHLQYPFLGSRRIVDALADDGIVVNRKKVQRLMRIMGIAALYPKPRTHNPGSWAPGLPVSAARTGNRPAQPGVVLGHNVSADGPRLPVPGRGHGLVLPQGAVLAAVKHDGPRFLRRCPARGHRHLRRTGDFQQRPGISGRIPVVVATPR